MKKYEMLERDMSIGLGCGEAKRIRTDERWRRRKAGRVGQRRKGCRGEERNIKEQKTEAEGIGERRGE